MLKFAMFMALVTGASHGASVTISTGLAGTSVQGVSLTTSADNSVLVNSSEYYVGVGRYVSGVFTPWGGTTLALDTAAGSPAREVSGTFTTSTGGAFDGLGLHVFVGLLSSVANASATSFTPGGISWAVFSSTANPTFQPSAGTGSSTFNFTTTGTLTFVAKGDPTVAFNGSSNVSGSATNFLFLPVPEPSAALLGMLGALGLLRRRR